MLPDNQATDANQNNAGIANAAELTLIGWDCVIIPGAQAPQLVATDGDPDIAQTTADLSQTISDGTIAPLASPPQICGNLGLGYGASTAIIAANIAGQDGVAENFTICSKLKVSR